MFVQFNTMSVIRIYIMAIELNFTKTVGAYFCSFELGLYFLYEIL